MLAIVVKTLQVGIRCSITGWMKGNKVLTFDQIKQMTDDQIKVSHGCIGVIFNEVTKETKPSVTLVKFNMVSRQFYNAGSQMVIYVNEARSVKVWMDRLLARR